MAGKNETVQKIKLNTKDYVEGQKKVREESKNTTQQVQSDLTKNSTQVAQNEAQYRKWGNSVREELKKFGKDFRENLSTGAKALTLGLGSSLIKKAASDSVAMAVDASKRFADLRSRIGASEEQLQKWSKAIDVSAVKTKANLSSMQEAFSDLSDSANPDEIMKFLDQIGGATTMTGGDSHSVTQYLKDTLTGQGKEINAGNVNEALTSADILRRKGRGFGDMTSAMGALGSFDQNAVRNSGLSSRNLASILAGASRAGVSSSGAVKGIQDLIGANNNGIQSGSVLASILGTTSLSGKNGQFDISKIGGGGQYQRLMGLGGGNEKKAQEVFRSISGLSAEGSDAVFKMIKNFKDLNATMQEAEKDQKSFAQSAAESSDNIKDAYQGMQDSLVVGFKDIFGPLENPIKSLLAGNLGGAMKSAPGAVGGLLKGVADHPALIAGSIAATAAGGALISGLLSKIPGLGGMAGTAAGVAIGTALKQAGVEPVYVVNATEIGESVEGGGKGGMGFMGKLGMVGAAGAAGFGIGEVINKVTGNKGQMGDWAYDKVQQIKVWIDSKDPQFMGKPQSTNNVRDAKVNQ